MPGVAVGNGAQRVDAVNLGLADADEDSSRKRNGEAASSVEGGQSGRKDSIIIPWEGATDRSDASSSAEIAPALACGSSPVSVSTRSHIARR